MLKDKQGNEQENQQIGTGLLMDKNWESIFEELLRDGPGLKGEDIIESISTSRDSAMFELIEKYQEVLVIVEINWEPHKIFLAKDGKDYLEYPIESGFGEWWDKLAVSRIRKYWGRRC